MIGVIVCTHSTLAQGLKNAVEMIAGPQENFDAVCFMNGDDPEDLKEKLGELVKKYNDNNIPCCLVADLFAATPFNTALALSMENDLEVLTGANLPLLLELLMSREMWDDEDLHAFLENAMNSVRESMVCINGKALNED